MPKTVSIQEAVIYDCCNKNCLKFYNIDGSLDYGKTCKLITSSRESIAMIPMLNGKHVTGG